MNNWEVCQIFYEIADLLDILGENPFKGRAYRKAARSLENITLDLEQLVRENKLKDVPGIGPAIASKIKELVETGKLAYYEELKAKVPPGLLEILNIPGVGVKTVQILYKFLHITSPDELEAAAREHRLQTLPGIGKKTEDNILHGIKLMKDRQRRWPLNFASFVVDEIKKYFEGIEEIDKVEVAGSYRRGKETVGDLDFVVSSKKPSIVVDQFIKAPWVQEVFASGDMRATVMTRWGIQVDLLAVIPPLFTSALHHFTGSQAHNVSLREKAKEKGYKISEYGIVRDSETYTPSTEKEFYEFLGMSYIPPELREDRGEIEASIAGKLPNLVEKHEIKGDLHVHSNWSDGINSLYEILNAAQSCGYQYIAISDHSKSLGIANGLTEERLIEQKNEISRLNEELHSFHILSGVEVDILSNNELDFDDKILSEMDIVIASVHSGFKQNKEILTERIVSALKNENVDIIGHCTGRLLGKREPYPLDISRILEVAAKTGTALEINSSPERLDLNDSYIHEGKKLGVKFAINTDAHDVNCLNDIKYGILTARRGWAEKNDIINTLSFQKLKSWLKNRDKIR